MPWLTGYKSTSEVYLANELLLELGNSPHFQMPTTPGSFGFQLISATNDSYSGFLPLIMLKNQFIVSRGFKRTFSQRFLVAVKPLCTPLSLKPHGTHSREALSIRTPLSLKPRGTHSREALSIRGCLLSLMAVDPCTEVTTRHRNPILSKNSPASCLYIFQEKVL